MEGNRMQLLLLQANKSLSNEIVNEMIALMSNVVVRQILLDIREASIYTTDVRSSYV